ncbi:transposase IS3/IS911 family protein [Pseudomonas syringae pv. actinidiae ICMP 18807]|uniref:Transposase IS3/IS911 family protein n=1 Tax=Pseudomonas syringae pv. actinidiae ICMP 18807 TaxID=1194404 RepID=S6V9X7_PSESF|nr:transposase IS3/IS911 family protein [Pseudomonas syringae pv. actinidiae ICMP 18807]
MDLFSRKIVGWAMAPHMRAELVTSAMQLAIAQRQPEPGLIAHSDRGSQYAGAAYQALLTRNGMRCSMSRKGNCWDNAVMERFFLNLKMERTWRKDYANNMSGKRPDDHRLRCPKKVDHCKPCRSLCVIADFEGGNRTDPSSFTLGSFRLIYLILRALREN